MSSIAAKVEQIVSESAFLTEGMVRGLINFRRRDARNDDRWRRGGHGRCRHQTTHAAHADAAEGRCSTKVCHAIVRVV